MPNPNFTASVIPNALVRMSDIFTGGNTRYASFSNKTSRFIEAINRRQTARINNIMAGGRCVGVEVSYLKDCTAVGAYACKTAAVATPDCNVPLGASITSAKFTYDPKCVIDEAKSLSDDLCNNDYTAEELFAETLALMVTNLDIKMNRYAINQISAKASANLTPSPIGTVVGTRTEIPESLWTSDLLVQLETEAMYNGLDNYMIFDSMNFMYQKNNAQYRSLNDNERNQQAQFNAWDSRLVFDNPRDIFDVTARQSSFFVDMDMIAFINRTSYTSATPVLVDERLGIYHFSVVSPRTGVRYDFDYQKECTGRNDLTNHYSLHKLYGRFVGGIEFAPVQCDNSTGILEYVKV